MAGETRQVRREARSDLKLGKRLEHYEVLSAAMDAGAVNPAQGRAITEALDRLPSTGELAVDEEQLAEAEQHLVGLAADHDAKRLRLLGLRIFEVLAPELADEFEGRKLEQEEARARRRTSFTMWEDGDGLCHGRFAVPHLHGEMLRKMILAIASYDRPADRSVDGSGHICEWRRPGPADTGAPRAGVHRADRVGLRVRAAQVRRMRGDRGGDDDAGAADRRPRRAGVCTLDTGGRISAAEARRLACAAGIIPMVLSGKSQVLDVGRKRRLHSEGMRVAMGVRDGGCTTQGCETPPGMCHAHHDLPWSEGGHTNVATGRLLCPHHHRRIHDPGYAVSRSSGGKVSFHRRT